MVGGGHNGLVAACYLAGAGLSVAVLERRSVVGGAAVTEELIPGFRVSTASYVLSLMPRRLLDELDLWSAGVQYLPREPRIFVPFPDGTSLTWWSDPARLHAELAKISKRDADRFADYEAFIERAATVMDRFILRNPPSWSEVAAEFRSPADLAVFQKCFLGSAADIAEHFFESEKLQAVVAATGVIGTFRGPRDPGTGYVKLYHSMGMATGSRGAWTYVRGAMGAVTQALARVAAGRGAVLRTGVEVKRDPDPGRARHRRGAGGRRGDRRRASSSRTPTPCGRTSGSCRAASCRTTTGALVEGDQDREPGDEDQPGGGGAAAVLDAAGGAGPRGLLGRALHRAVDRLHAARVRRGAGRPPGRPPVHERPPPVGRRRHGRAGRTAHALDLHPVLPVPAGRGDVGRRGATRSATRCWPSSAGTRRTSPARCSAGRCWRRPDLEARFGLTGGHIFHGELVPEQAFDLRPVPGSTSYEGPIRGLYLCGSGAWPGGCVMGAPGHNAAQEVIARVRAGRG